LLFNTVHTTTKIHFTSGDSFCCSTLLELSIIFPEGDPLRVDTCWVTYGNKMVTE